MSSIEMGSYIQRLYVPHHFHRGCLKYPFLGSAFFKGFYGDPTVVPIFFVVRCFPSTSTRSSYALSNLKKVGNVKETVEQFKEIGISLINKASESITSSTLLIDSTSSVVFLPNFAFFQARNHSFIHFL